MEKLTTNQEIMQFAVWLKSVRALVDEYKYDGQKVFEPLYQCYDGCFLNVERACGYYLENKEECVRQIDDDWYKYHVK